MTDARLPGYWLTEMRFLDLTDKQWRVFTGLLMWSVEQGTDGHVPTRYVGTVHLDGVDDEDLEALVACDVLERVSTGVQLLGWADPRGLRQSTAEQVAKYRQGGRERQAAFRARQKTRDVTRDVGEGFHSEISSASAYVPGDSTRRNALRVGTQEAPIPARGRRGRFIPPTRTQRDQIPHKPLCGLATRDPRGRTSPRRLSNRQRRPVGGIPRDQGRRGAGLYRSEEPCSRPQETPAGDQQPEACHREERRVDVPARLKSEDHMNKIPAPKPANFDALSRTWNDPVAFARERAAYYASLSSTEVRDVTVPIHERADA